MLKLPKEQWLSWFAETPLESISEWVRYYYISPVDYSYNDDGTIIKIDDVIGIIDLSSQQWTKNYDYGGFFYTGITTIDAWLDTTNPAPIYLKDYKIMSLNEFQVNVVNMTAVLNNRILGIRNAELQSKTTSEIAAAFNGVELIYLKA